MKTIATIFEEDILEIGSLFAGIGGFDLGFERAGMRCVWQVEKDPFCQKVLNKHWPDVERFEDVKEVGKHNLRTVDVICGGFPCQPHSYAGKRKGAADDRNLWPETCRVVKELKPTYFVGENVPGIRTTILDQVLSDLESMDYATETIVIPACAFDAPHRRERVFIIAYNPNSQRLRRLGNGIYEKKRQQGNKPPDKPSPLGKTVAHTGSAGLPKPVCRELGSVLEKTRPPARSEFSRRSATPGRQWEAEPRVGRVADGVPCQVDRLRSLGNAVVPQVAEFIATLILQHNTAIVF